MIYIEVSDSVRNATRRNNEVCIFVSAVLSSKTQIYVRMCAKRSANVWGKGWRGVRNEESADGWHERKVEKDKMKMVFLCTHSLSLSLLPSSFISLRGGDSLDEIDALAQSVWSKSSQIANAYITCIV